MARKVLATMVTTTSYGTWLPGDLRDCVRDGKILPGDPKLLDASRALLSQAPVYFSVAQQTLLLLALRNAAEEFGYVLTDVSIESWHPHWIVDHGFDPVDDMVGRLKNRMRQMLNRGRVWTRGYCHRCMETRDEVLVARDYVSRHAGVRMIDGKPTLGEAGG